eukprot:scaffold494668_cov48-Prasinocladus_malaysianus.AAC.1
MDRDEERGFLGHIREILGPILADPGEGFIVHPRRDTLPPEPKVPPLVVGCEYEEVGESVGVEVYGAAPANLLGPSAPD